MSRKRVALYTSAKGGVGKTTASRGHTDIARATGIRTGAWDGDGSVGQLLAFYGQRDSGGEIVRVQEPAQGVGYFDVRTENGRETLLSVIDADVDLAIVDLPGGSIRELAAVVPHGLRGLAELYAEEGWEPIIVQVITPLRACAEDAVELAEMWRGAPGRFVVMKNLGRGEPDAFYLFEGDGGKLSNGNARKAVDDVGGTVINMPAIRGRTYAYVDAYRLPFSAAAQRREEYREYRGDQRWIRAWLDEFKVELDQAGLL